MNPTVSMLLVGLLALIGISLFLFNVRQAVGGYRQMKRIDREAREAQSQTDTLLLLNSEIEALCRSFESKVLSFGIGPEDRARIWGPVDGALARSIKSLLAGNATTAESELRTAIAEARRILADFNDEDCGC